MRFIEDPYSISKIRSYTTPIPMAVLAAWENRILSGDSNPAEILTLGCFLIATMASLRFRDLLRHQNVCIRTTLGRLLPWHCHTTIQYTLGLPIPGNCGIHEPAALGQTMEPSWTDSIPFTSPCSHHHGVALIRSDIMPNVTGYNSLFYRQMRHGRPTVWSPHYWQQLEFNLNVEQRAKQGHHRHSVKLFSRDVWPSLFLQPDFLMGYFDSH